MTEDIQFMHRCLQLARLGGGYVAPNPMVGSVIVHNGKIIGEGYHKRYGEPHAEPNAIGSVKDKSLLKESILYVNLEPCSHFGKTPPCSNLIVASGIPKVVIGTSDPNPKVSGRGIAILRAAGIDVTVGVLEAECRILNKRFFVFQEEKRPFILLKWAQTRDGFMDHIRTLENPNPLQISNHITMQLTHKMRSENQSILVSTNTVVMDNPSLTVRNWPGKTPVRLALDRIGRIPDDFKILDNQHKTLIFTERPKDNKEKTEYIQINFEHDGLQSIISEIYKRNIHSVLVEGGSKLLNSFIRLNLWDEAHVEISNQMIRDGIPAPVLSAGCTEHDNINGHEWLTFVNTKKIKQ